MTGPGARLLLRGLCWALSAVTIGGCFSSDPGPQIRLRTPVPTSPPVQRVTAALEHEPPSMAAAWSHPTDPEARAVQDLLHVGLAAVDDQGRLEPRLAEVVPTLDNQGVRILPDGRLEVTWQLREHARWHDGTPVTTDDLVFTLAVVRDSSLPALAHPAYALIERIEAVDSRTARVTWRAATVYADQLFSSFARPLPRHRLEAVYNSNRSALLDDPYWTSQFVGTGPFRVQAWERGRLLLLRANPEFVLGRPGLDAIDVQFIADPNQLRERAVGGSIQLSLGDALPIDQAGLLVGHWREGRVQPIITGWVAAVPQLRDPHPPILASAQFRRALAHATDRLHLADTLQRGLVGVAHTFVSTDASVYGPIEEGIVRYSYDPQAAVQLIQQLGYVRDRDGQFRAPDGAPLGVVLRVPVGNELLRRTAIGMVEDWRSIGVGADLLVGGPDEADPAWPGFALLREEVSADQPLGASVVAVRASQDATYASLADRYLTAPFEPERTRALGDLVRYESEEALRMGVFYDGYAALIASQVQNVAAPRGPESSIAWNAHQWSLR